MFAIESVLLLLSTNWCTQHARGSTHCKTSPTYDRVYPLLITVNRLLHAMCWKGIAYTWRSCTTH